MRAFEQIKSNPKSLFIIDTFAHVFRAYYALGGGGMSTAQGEPTNVSFGYSGMLLKILRSYRPTHWVMATECEGPTFRDEIYPEYKANRDAPPDDLDIQIPRVFELANAMNLPVLASPGAEADDVIGTLVELIINDARYDDVTLYLISKDKDLEQLIGPRVHMLDVYKDELINEATLMEKKGYRPDQVIDVLTLTGDSVDNIKGVDGIGIKTAAKLLKEYDTLDNLLANIDQIKGKRKEKLEAAQDHLPLSKQLVTLKKDLPINFDLAACQSKLKDPELVRSLFVDLGFRRRIQELDDLLDPPVTDETQDQKKGAVSRTSKDEGQGSLFGTMLVNDGDTENSQENGNMPDEDLYTTASDFSFRSITSTADLHQLIETLSRVDHIAIDTETTGLERDATMCGISLAWLKPYKVNQANNADPVDQAADDNRSIDLNQIEAIYIPTRLPENETCLSEKEVISRLEPVLNRSDLKLCGHHLKFDLHILKAAGLNLFDAKTQKFDTMISAFLCGYSSQSLDILSQDLLKHKNIPISSLIGTPKRGKRLPDKTIDQVSLEKITDYAAEDAFVTYGLWQHFENEIQDKKLAHLAFDIEMPLIDVLASMENCGIKVLPEELEQQKQRLSKQIDELRSDIFEANGGYVFNIDSPKQLADVLFNQLDLPVIKKNKSGPSTDMEVLEKLSDREDLPSEKLEVPRLVLQYRHLTKLVNTYLDSLQEEIHPGTGRIHAQFHQTGAETGRLSSSHPNLQNIPIRTEIGRQIRKAFIAEDEHILIAADYSQIELRVLAHLSQDEKLIASFKNGEDIHRAVAAEVFDISPEDVTGEQRSKAKTVNFGIIYGITAYGLSRRIANLDVSDAKQLILDYHMRFPRISEFLDECIIQAERKGFVTTMFGRRRKIPQIRSRNRQTKFLGERLAINSVVQGSAADLIKLAMVKLQHKIAEGGIAMNLLLQIHDELVIESPKHASEQNAAILKETMESASTMDVPLLVDVGMGATWFDAK